MGLGTILLSFPHGRLSEEDVTRVQAVAPDAHVVLTRDREAIRAMLDEVEIAAGSFPRELFAEAHNLRWYQQWWTGVDWLMRHPEAVEMDFVLTNTSGMQSIPISEHVFALLLGFARDLHRAVRAQSRHEWIPFRQQHLFELAHKRMLLVGVGAIGRRVARLAQALEIEVWGVRNNAARDEPHVEAMFGPARLQELLPQVDFVVLTVPLTEETRGMIGAPELEAMKPTAYLINVGRGDVIEEQALIHALETDQIAGAGLDVFEEEPLPEDSPLWDMETVIVTSHYAGLTPHYNERALEIFLDNLRRYQAGEPLRNVVNKERGY